MLLKAGAEDRRGNTALIATSFKGELAIARRLVATDCQPNQRNHAGQTAAMYAALFQRTEILQALKRCGADLQATDGGGNTPAALAKVHFE